MKQPLLCLFHGNYNLPRFAQPEVNNKTTFVSGFIILVSIFLLSTPLFAASLPSGFKETRIAKDLDPVDMQIAPDGRIFLTEKNGKIRIIKNDNLIGRPFMNLQVDNYNERGLMGLAFDPNFLSNQYIYVYYTVKNANHNRVSRFKANGDVVQAGSETVLIDINPSNAGNHNGGALFFKDGKLFITTGDGASAGNAQNMSTLLGKVLRINPDGSIPSDNPFVDQTSGKYRAIWALGLRNPFKASVQAGTGKIYVNDVGSSRFEEINEIIRGKNYGWPTIEGRRTNQNPPANYQDPVYAYATGQGCSITGGAFYNPSDNLFPAEYRGRYFYADYCGGYIKTLDVSNNNATANFATGIDRPIDIKVSLNGTLYYIARGGRGGGSQSDNTSSNDGTVWKVEYTGSGLPTISANPANQTAPLGGSAIFTVSGSGSGTLRYQWQRNGSNISGATAASYTISQVSMNDNGASFRCVISNANGSVTSAGAILTVTLNQGPVATITSPAASWLYTGGGVINFGGNGTDPEQGSLPASAFSWKIDFHHDDHMHPAMENVSGTKSGTFQIPKSGETAANVWYRIYLTVTDDKGLKNTTYRDIYPVKAQITLTSVPSGLQVKLDGQSVTTPYTFTGVAGIVRTIEAVNPQELNAKAYEFVSWSDKGSMNHNINTPSTNSTFTAVFKQTETNTNQGLNYAYYEGDWSKLPNFKALTPKKTGKISNFSLSPKLRDSSFGFDFNGNINITTTGTYTFFTSSDDGSRLFINNKQVVNNDGLHAQLEKSGSVYLTKGKHSIRVTFFERFGDEILQVKYQGPGVNKQTIPNSALSTDNQSQQNELSGAYMLIARHSGKALSVASNATGNGANVQQNTAQGTSSQVWIISPAGGSYYTLSSQLSGKLLDVTGSSTANGANVQQWDNKGKDNQKWSIEPVGDGYYVIKAKHSGKVLDVAFAGTADGSNVQQWHINGTNAQMWKLEKVGSSRLSAESERIPDDLRVTIHPNPASDQLTVTYEAVGAGEAQLIILDMMSRQTTGKTFTIQEGKNTLAMDVSKLEQGMYFIRIVEQGKSVTKKVLISR